MKSIAGCLAVIGLVALPAPLLHAASAGTAGGIVLKQDFNPRAEGMGEAFTAVADDVYAMYWNPAGLSYLLGDAGGAGFSNGLTDDAFGQVSYAHAYNTELTFGLGISTYSGGNFNLIDDTGNTTRRNAQTDYLFSLSGAYTINEEFAAGATLELLHSTLVETYSAMTAAVTLAGSFVPNFMPALRVGAAVKHLGLPMKYENEADPLPLTAQIGGAYQLLKSELNKPGHDLLVALDASLGWDTPIYVNLGAEYWFRKMLAARLGYKVNREVEGLTLGLGIKYPALKDLPLELDYSFSLNTEFNSVHKLALELFLPKNPARLTNEELKARKKAEKEAEKRRKAEEARCKKEAEEAAARQAEIEKALPPITLQVLEITKVGGVAKSLILNAGLNTKGVKKGVIGVIYNPGRALAGKCKLTEVYKQRSQAAITDLNSEISAGATVELVR